MYHYLSPGRFFSVHQRGLRPPPPPPPPSSSSSGVLTPWPQSAGSTPIIRPRCSKEGDPPGRGSADDSSKGERNPRDWDKAWSAYRKLGKKKSFLSKMNPNFDPDKYVSWDPKRSEYPLSEEVDPIKRTERTNLQLWTSPKFTLFGAVIVVSLLLVYTLSAPTK